MPVSIRVFPLVLSRPCRFCLSLQDDSVFADFDTDGDSQVFLRRISFDGYGCCSAPENITKMTIEDSRTLIEAVDQSAVEKPKVEEILRSYFQANREAIWEDALISHDLL